MAASTSGALKAYVEGLGLGLAVYRDQAPKDAPLPFVTVIEDLTTTLNADGDLGDHGAQQTVRELVQVSLWQTWRDSAGRVAETYGLGPTLAARLRGAQLVPVGSRRTYGVSAVSYQRLLEEEANVVHHAITVTVHREA